MSDLRTGPTSKPLVYNARVFDLTDPDGLLKYNQVMRRHLDHLVNTPPSLHFSSRDGSLRVYIDWMSDRTYEEEFLGEAAPPAPPTPEDGEVFAPSTAVADLAARLRRMNPLPARPANDDPTKPAA